MYKSAYVLGAIDPLTGRSSASIAPTVNTHLMDLMGVQLRMIAEEAGPDTHVVLVLDGAGWHRAKDLVVPELVTLLLLPSYATELMSLKQVWQWLRQHDLSNRICKDEAAIDEACKGGWNKPTPDRLMSTTATGWITNESEAGSLSLEDSIAFGLPRCMGQRITQPSEGWSSFIGSKGAESLPPAQQATTYSHAGWHRKRGQVDHTVNTALAGFSVGDA